MDDRTSPQQLARNDLDRFRLRNFIEELGNDELDMRNDPVDLADVAAILHGNPKAVWFSTSTARPCSSPVTSSAAARAWRARSGVAPDQIIQEIQRRLQLRLS